MLPRLRWKILAAALVLLPNLLMAAEVPVRLNIDAEGGVLTKEVKSLKELRQRQMVPQSKDFSCGAAALATLLRYYYGYQMTELDAILGMFKYGEPTEIKKRGFSLLDMKRYTESLKYKGQGFKVPKLELLQNLTIPVITLIETNRYKHFVVIRQADDKYVYLSDPAWGNRKVSWQDFEKVWTQKVIFVVQGSKIGTPEGLFFEKPKEASNLSMVLNKDILIQNRFALDPADSMIFIYYRPLINFPPIVPGLQF